MRFLVLSDMFSLESWLIDEVQPKIMPAVYNFFNFLGNSKEHRFTGIIFHPKTHKTFNFPNGSTIHILRLGVPFHYLRKFVSFYQMKTIGQRFLDQEQYDVIYGMSIYSVVAASLGRKNKIPSVGRIFGSLIWDEMNNGNSWILHTRFYFQLQEAKNPADILICTEDGTQFDKALAKLNPQKRVYMLYNGIDSSLKSRLLKLPLTSFETAPKINFFSIGRLTYWKRHDLAIEVIDLLKNQYGYNQIQLTILGKGEEHTNLTKLIKSKKLQHQISIKSPIPHHDLPLFLSQQNIALFMYDASNMGNAMWESCLAGKLICTRPTGKTASVFTHQRNAIIAKNPSEMADHIAQLNLSETVQLCQNSRKLVDKLLPTWENRFDKELEIIGREINE